MSSTSTTTTLANLNAHDDSGLSSTRRLVATLGAVCATLAIPMTILSESKGGGPDRMAELVVIMVPVVLCAVSAFALHFRHLGAQIFARATWWSNLILGTLISISASGSEVKLGIMFALGSGVALLAMAREGLSDDVPAGKFNPSAFRTSLILTMVMALADTQSLMFFGGMTFVDDGNFGGLLCAAVMTVAVVGLFRLKVWGVALNLVANLAVAGLAVTDVLDLPDPIVGALVTTAVLQLALPIPLLVAMKVGKADGDAAPARWRWPAAATVIGGMMALSAYATFLHDGRLMHF